MKNSYFIVKKSSRLRGEIIIPPSKSHTLRAIIFATLARGVSVIKNPLDSADSRVCLRICQKLGAKIKAPRNSDTWLIQGRGGNLKIPKSEINVGNSGIALRFIGGLMANSVQEVRITGDQSIRTNRPMQPMINALKKLGVKAKSIKKNGFAPLVIKGPITKKQTSVVGADSQFVSGLLIGSLLANHDIVIRVINPGEKPWVEMTLSWFKRLGLKYENKDYQYYKVFADQEIKSFEATIPADFSSAAYFIAAALITKDSQIKLRGLDMRDCQGDKKIIDVLKKMGAKIDDIGKDTLVVKSSDLTGRNIDVNDFIDAVPILAVAGCFAKGVTKIKNAAIARTKECNRLAGITEELLKMGADIREVRDGLEVKRSDLKGAIVDSRGDHRMAFSLAVAGLGAKGLTKIRDIDCISKTMPNFIDLMQDTGALIEKREGNKNIIITGLKSSGKSTLGSLVAKELKIDFIDTDKEIERLFYYKFKKKMNFREIFRYLGEKKFRRFEGDVINNLANCQNIIISLGGGALMNSIIRDKIKELGYVFFLDVPFGVLWRRIIEKKELPVFLNNENPKTSFWKIYNERRAIYLKNCDAVLDFSRINMEQAKQEIVQKAKQFFYKKW